MATRPTEAVLAALAAQEINLADFLISLLGNPYYQDHPVLINLIARSGDLCTVFYKNRTSSGIIIQWALDTAKQYHSSEILALSDPEHGWHFGAVNATIEQLENFKIEQMAKDLERLSLETWNLLGAILWVSKHLSLLWMPSVERSDNEATGTERVPRRSSITTGLDPMLQTKRVPGIGHVLSSLVILQSQNALSSQKQTVVISIMIQSMSQQCNALASVIGIFLHSCNAPEKVIKTLARMGVSISMQSVNNAISALSIDAKQRVREMGQLLTIGYIHDNFDVNFPTLISTVEKSVDTLAHMTSADAFWLQECLLEDLRCSEQLWQKSPFNNCKDDHSGPQ
ncbi:hypothetical protein HETIRDRAFT_326030 [Heterobasidion irregulare TC 32-1]|uniref:Uncharacterized protein n=1 Tax=Heterobasidion irregulare (strain TC 32-1) TaxID=747525 RepID=W4JXC4_HETIT|nr:uncharacterized protein HETIRDRAFT_326030 [Heterobasidion irregulare TC 32-1]ETW78198.1 hypothetical protein HETIRDRAFT_326030 [Heterobasidion irregulare TC 32-1]